MNPVEALSALYEPGDIVEIVRSGQVYTSYRDFFEEQGVQHLQRYWKEGEVPSGASLRQSLYVVEHTGGHRIYPAALYIIRNIETDDVYIFHEDGIALVQKNAGTTLICMPNISEDELLSILIV